MCYSLPLCPTTRHHTNHLKGHHWCCNPRPNTDQIKLGKNQSIHLFKTIFTQRLEILTTGLQCFKNMFEVLLYLVYKTVHSRFIFKLFTRCITFRTTLIPIFYGRSWCSISQVAQFNVDEISSAFKFSNIWWRVDTMLIKCYTPPSWNVEKEFAAITQHTTIVMLCVMTDNRSWIKPHPPSCVMMSSGLK